MSFLWNTGLSQPFSKLPSKRYYPDYYKEIATPMSLQQIRNKLLVSIVGRACIINLQPHFCFFKLFFSVLQNGNYETVSDVAGDLNLMFENAKFYNRPDSKIYKVECGGYCFLCLTAFLPLYIKVFLFLVGCYKITKADDK